MPPEGEVTLQGAHHLGHTFVASVAVLAQFLVTSN